MPDAPALTFPSKVDRWLAVVLLIFTATGPVGIGIGLTLLATRGLGSPGWVPLGTGIFTLALMGLLVWPVRYTLAADRLIIRFGVIRVKIPYARITGARPERSILSSPALSFDRVQVDYEGGAGFTLISPDEKDRFLRELAARAPHLAYADGKVSRAPAPE